MKLEPGKFKINSCNTGRLCTVSR